MAFFLNQEEQEKYEKEHGKVEKKKSRTTRGKTVAKRLKHSSKVLQDGLEFSGGKLIQSTTFLTEFGIKSINIYEEKDGRFVVKTLDASYQVIEEQTFKELEEAKDFFKTRISTIDTEESGLVKCIEDVLTRIGTLTDEMMFLYKLLIDPEERRDYELAEQSKKPPSKKIQSVESSQSNEEDLVKAGNHLRQKIKGLESLKRKMPRETDYPELEESVGGLGYGIDENN